MELVKNKASGKIFVVLDDIGNGDFLVITPDGKVKHLEKCLFTSLSDMDREGANEKQLTVYEDYFGEPVNN